MRSPGGMFLENVDPQDFDAQFFAVSQTDAIAMDPQQRQLVEVVYESFENAGLRLEDLDEAPVGCLVGAYAVDYADIQACNPDDRAPSVTVGVGRAILSNRISHFLNIKGPSMTTDTACSVSLVAVGLACSYLSTGQINGAIVAGANIYLGPEHSMDRGSVKGVHSFSGKCHTFDVKANGYIKAENAVISKRLEDAVRNGDPIRAVIRDSATNSDGHTPGIASPSTEAQASAIRAAYDNADILDLGKTTYPECHGTGTQAGDPLEVRGISSVFSDTRPLEQPMIIGSDIAVAMGIVPANEGHGVRERDLYEQDYCDIRENIPPGRPHLFRGYTVSLYLNLTVLICPDQDASTMPGVYLRLLYCLFDLANTQRGQRVLIHSASGGVGIACIQLCQYIGAEVHATIGTEEKKQCLMSEFGIASAHIFNSRSIAFAANHMSATNSEGVDVIINSLTGDRLDESWRHIANGGTMVEIGKKDMLEHNSLSMEPFGRNASYRGFHLTYEHVSDMLIARLLHQMMDLAEKGHIQAIAPVKFCAFEDVLSAFLFMRGGNHIGKIVISSMNGFDDKTKVPVSPPGVIVAV